MDFIYYIYIISSVGAIHAGVGGGKRGGGGGKRMGRELLCPLVPLSTAGARSGASEGGRVAEGARLASRPAAVGPRAPSRLSLPHNRVVGSKKATKKPHYSARVCVSVCVCVSYIQNPRKITKKKEISIDIH